MADSLAAKKRYTPPPSVVHNSSIEGLGNQYRQNFSSEMKVITIFSHRILNSSPYTEMLNTIS